MDAGYSRNTASVLENVIWPDISTLSEYLNSRFTFCLHRSFIIRMNTSRYRRNWSIFSACYMKNSLKPGCLPQEIRIPPSAKSCKRYFCLPHFLQHYRFLSLYAKESEISEVLNGSPELTNTLQTIVTEKAAMTGIVYLRMWEMMFCR